LKKLRDECKSRYLTTQNEIFTLIVFTELVYLNQ
jgi:hypothetical protein